MLQVDNATCEYFNQDPVSFLDFVEYLYAVRSWINPDITDEYFLTEEQ